MDGVQTPRTSFVAAAAARVADPGRRGTRLSARRGRAGRALSRRPPLRLRPRPTREAERSGALAPAPRSGTRTVQGRDGVTRRTLLLTGNRLSLGRCEHRRRFAKSGERGGTQLRWGNKHKLWRQRFHEPRDSRRGSRGLPVSSPVCPISGAGERRAAEPRASRSVVVEQGAASSRLTGADLGVSRP